MSDLFVISRADIFAIYPKILANILHREELKRAKDGVLTQDFIPLPTDNDYQERVYYRLLAVQKGINDLIDSGIPLEEVVAKKIKQQWDPDLMIISPLSTPASGLSLNRKKCVVDDPMDFVSMDMLSAWNLNDLTNAGKLLRKPPLPCHFRDEHEMRRVYSMIYDVYRYKHILNQALHDVKFFQHYPQLRDDQNRVWLLLFDLHLRHFLRRDPKERVREKELYHKSDLQVIHDNIWNNRIHLAASISRLRIKNSALNLMELLPPHLQDNDKVAIATANPIVTGWINPFKLPTKAEAIESFRKIGFLESEEAENGEVPLKQLYFKFDKLCPLFLSCIPLDRSEFAKSVLMKENLFIMQDRAFTLGPAIFSRLLEYFEVEGDVIQTHLSSQRSIAYLGGLFQGNYRVNDIIIFGAGQRLHEYNDYMHKLEISNIRMRSENFCQMPIQSTILEKVVGVFITTPNSYSAINDPIDLICSRGGDLSMLEVLTESEMSESGKERVAKILEEQRESLRLAMSRPQVQFILYGTHSMVETENKVMVNLAIESVNRAAHARHVKMYKEKKRLEALAEQDGLNAEQLEKLQGIPSSKKKSKSKEDETKNAPESESSSDESESGSEILENSNCDDEYSHIKVPKTDIFESIDIPDMCMYQNKCIDAKSSGCFLSLIKRKKITRLDEKHLILMAEKRGLFGDTNPKKERARIQSRSTKKEEHVSIQPVKIKRKRSEEIELLVDRLSQHTHSSLIRSDNVQKQSHDHKLILFFPRLCEYSYQHHKRQEEWINREVARQLSKE
ncbi:uncharacterized protein LOC116347169 [Contarinia nasturtii]|uniref:uncharacterized protein LOC116347169 n=1 Tax=Contarinia nasturtii TaxID=265458 RepID=UPI0012D4B481|nr:uncharacterized protein LOC116347169 [Contarinia nasturtii]